MVEALENERDHLRTQNARLTEALLSMKKEGYQYQGPAITDSPDPVSLPDVVMAAITETSGNDQELAINQMVYAQNLIDGGEEPEFVAKIIRDGVDTESFE